MEKEENIKNNDDFGKMVEMLHNKSKLSSLRTYQGDTAEFIRSKNESVISIATKEWFWSNKGPDGKTWGHLQKDLRGISELPKSFGDKLVRPKVSAVSRYADQ